MKRTPEAVGRENLESIVGLQQKIIPEMRDLLEKRYELLKHISYHATPSYRTFGYFIENILKPSVEELDRKSVV